MLLSQRILVAAGFAVCLLLCPKAAMGFDHPAHGDLPDLDKRREAQREAKPLPPGQAAATEKLKERVPGLRVERDELLQTPKHVSSASGFLSGPNGEGKAITPARVRALRADDPHRVVKAFLNEHAAVFGYGAEVLDPLKPRRDAVSRKNGLRTAVWEQQVANIPVYEAVLISHTTAQGELVSISSQFMPDAARAAGAVNRAEPVVAPTVTSARAVLIAAGNLQEPVQAPDIVAIDVMPEGNERRQRFQAGTLPGVTDVRLVWLPMNSSTLKLCWQVELTRHTGGERYRVLIDAQTEEIDLRQRLTVYLTDASYRVFTGDSPTPLSPGWPAPNTNQPPAVPRSLVTLNALNTNASPIGWISDGENETRGNNVDAHHDWNADDEPDLPRPQGTPFRTFDPSLDFNVFAFDYSDAAVVNLFYWCNWMHDQLYDLGFDEAAGNYQKDNFGRGGYGNDAIQADAQDGSGVNNANFTPAPDGVPGRVQMFLFTGPEPDRDGDFDTEVMLHELTHGLSTRLVGGGVGISALQSGGMGEGWSDFYALSLLSQPGDDPAAVYPFGAYVSYQFGGLGENYYFGIRRYPYATDLGKNPLTFKDIDPAQISSHAGVPVSPINPINPLFANEVHAAGEVWCVTLWEARANLIRKYGHAAGNRLVLQLVTDGMKLSPPNPTFLQARDAIILADQVNNAGENYLELWAAFARRGMGFSARAPDANTTVGIVEAFDLPDALFIVNPENLLASGPQAGPFAPDCRQYPLTNISSQPVTWSVRVSSPWLTASPAGGTLNPGMATNVTVCLTANAATQPLGSFLDTIVFSNATTKVAQTRRANLRVMAFASMPFKEDFESGGFRPYWSVTGTGAHRAEVTPLSVPHEGKYHLTLDAVGGISSRNEVTLGLDLAGYTNATLRFWAKNIADEPDGPPPTPFIDEADFDGVAISEDGTHWYEVRGLRFLSLMYEELVVDLDAAIATYGLHYNSTFRIRFNQFDNFQIPFDGLALDDISVTGTPVRRLVVTVPKSATEGAGTLAGRGVVTIGAPAPADLSVVLRSDDPSRVLVPLTVIIPAGSDRATFDLRVLDNAQLDGTVNVTISATIPGYFGQSATIAVADNETASLRVMLAPRAKEGDGMMVKMGTVRANPKPARDTIVSLSSSNPAKLGVPSSVTMPAGMGSVSFDLFVGDDGNIDGSQTVTVTAHVENWVDGRDSMLILDNDSPALSVVLPIGLSEGNGIVSNAGVVRLSGILPTNLTVSLASSDVSELVVPGTVEIPAGEIEARFDLTVVDDALADGPRSVTIAARARSFTTGSGTMTIFDNETPPTPYQPDPADKSSSVPVTLSLSWKPGVGEVMSEGGFESGSFRGWVTRDTGFGSWVINDGKIDLEGPDEPTMPFAGSYNAVTTQIGAGEHLLYQDVFLPQDAQSATLSWTHRIRNYAAYFSVPNQQFQVEIRDTSDNVLATAFVTRPEDPLMQDWEEHRFDVSEFRGRTIRVAFHQMDNLGYFNVHLDNVSLTLGGPPTPASYDIYFGTSPALGTTSLLASTTNAFWPLPQLVLNTTYYWQVVSRRGGTVTRGPVWQFTTRGVGNLHHFEWGRIASPEQVNQRFAVTVTARDDINNAVKDFTGPVTVTGVLGNGNVSRVLVSEIDVSVSDRMEFMNVSGDAIDLSGWEIFVYDATSWPGPLVKVTLPTGTVCPPGTVFQLNELGSAPGVFPNFYTGTNVTWNATVVANPVAILLRDASGEPVDFVAAGSADPSLIRDPMRIGKELWSGLPVFVAVTNTAETAQRLGAGDHHNAGDWRIAPNTFGSRNVGLSLPFTESGLIPVSPTLLTNFVTGVWSGFLTVQDVASRMTLRASDGHGHLGLANEFAVGASDDLAVSMSVSPDVCIVGNELAYSIVVSNSGPAKATGVMLTNMLPAEVAFVSAATFNGTCANSGREVVCDLGRLSEGDVAHVSIIARALVMANITNRTFVGRTETEAFALNNAAIVESTITGPIIYSTNIVVTETSGSNRDALLPVRLTVPCKLPVSVDYTTRSQTAIAGSDYVAVSGTLVFEPGVTSLIVPVPVIGDYVDEGLEQFQLILSSPTNGVVIGPPGRCRILDDDPLPAISVNDVTVTEGNNGSTNYALFSVTVVGTSDLPLFVNYTTLDETATSATDYMAVFGTLVFPVGASNLTVAVPIRADRRFEPTETFALSLSGQVNASLARLQGRATILDDDAEELDHFEWSAIASPQFVDVPFSASITAKDGLDRLAAGFNGPVQLSGVASRRQIMVGTGAAAWEQPLGTLFHDGRTQVIYLPEELGGAGRINALALDVRMAPGQSLTNWTIRMKHGTHRSYAPPAWESDGWTTVYRNDETISGNGWVTFLFRTPFVYNGTDPLMVDFSFNNVSFSANGMSRFTQTAEKRSIFFQTDSAFGDPLNWTGPTSPPPLVTNRIPNIRLSLEENVPLAPSGLVQIVNGVWSGPLIVGQPGTNIFLRASDNGGHIAESAEFTADSNADTNHNGLPDAWEIRYFGSLGAAGGGPGEDADHDGLTNLQEFQAGTDPTNAGSTVRIVKVERAGAEVTVSFNSVAGKTYRLERTLSVNAGAWTTVIDGVLGTGGIVAVTDGLAVPTGNCFYRISLVR